MPDRMTTRSTLHRVIAIGATAVSASLAGACGGDGSPSGPTPPDVSVVTTFAGSGFRGREDGQGQAASFNGPNGLDFDRSGNLYVADEGNNLIRKITPAGLVTTVAGSGNVGASDGTGELASFGLPDDVVVAPDGHVYVADRANNLIRKITPAGVVTTLAGSGAAGSTDGTGASASFNWPMSIAAEPSGDLIVVEYMGQRVRRVTTTGVVTTVAGSGEPGHVDGTGTAARFGFPRGVAVAASGIIYVADEQNNAIRRVTPAGVVTTLAGGTKGSADGTGTAAQFGSPASVSVDASGNVYVGENSNNLIRRVSPQGVVTTVAGTGSRGATNGTPESASFHLPRGIAVTSDGDIYVGDHGNDLIRRIRIR